MTKYFGEKVQKRGYFLCLGWLLFFFSWWNEKKAVPLRPISENLTPLSKNLVIVESPAKAKTIEKFLGKDYHVLSSQGHIRDIEGFGKKNSIGIDFTHGYTPNYVIDSHKQSLIQSLANEAKKADTVWLASDEDREGEAIAWHLKEVLQLPAEKTKRIVFHEITKPAILQAITEPRDIDYNLVNAQQARRVMDRIVGFELSPVLWRKITTGLSAGRVQSVAVRLIVEREQEIRDFQVSVQYRVMADFLTDDGEVLRTELNHRFATKEEAEAFLQDCQQASFTLTDVQTKPAKKSPAPPFTTSLLQQEAARKLRFPVSKTMRIAQTLYEAGLITYMRTDSYNLSSLAIGTSRQEILEEYGEEYHQERNYHTHTKGAQEAHEAIRPTYMNNHVAGSTADERHLYDLIWKRTIASQMADAQVEQTRMEVSISNSSFVFVALGEQVRFPGFMKVYIQSNDDDTEADSANAILPIVPVGTVLAYDNVTATESYAKAPYRYTEASLVKKMEELGIGRPSTYATIIETIQARDYVRRGNVTGQKRSYQVISLKAGQLSRITKNEQVGAESGKLIPTDLGVATNDFLVGQFPEILGYDFTAKAESSFDDIAEGKAEWSEVVDSFYQQFHPSIQQVEAGRWLGRELGIDPETGLPVMAKFSKQGPCIQIGSVTDDERPRFASLKEGQSIYTITLEEALSLFEHTLPYTLGEFEDKEVSVGTGKYGPYVRFDDLFISIPKSIDPLSITMDEAILLITKKRDRSLPIHVFGDIQVLHGRYGAYIKQGDKNYKIPRAQKPELLTEDDCKEIIAKSK